MTEDTKPQEEHKKPNIGHWVLTLLFFSLAVFLVGKNATDFHASVIQTRQAAPFDGTTLPVLTVPKWTSLGTELYKADYDAIPADKKMPLPVYNAETLKTPASSLGWKTESDLAIRNAKLTYSVVYMGNYKLDNIEYAGSHLAVDIKIPDNTPIYAIANGIVDKVSEQSTGFGNHIVIKHVNVPSLENSSAKTTLYSSYNHLNQVLVGEGEVVTKGQLIGKSGHSGTATTPHLHFQIDNDQAPWHPYWPFTYADANAAGVSFWDAINVGLGADKAKQTTINPMLYVQKYLKGTTATSTTTTSTSTSTTTSTTTTKTNTTTTVNTPATQETTQGENTDTTVRTTTEDPATSLVIENDSTFVVNAPETIKIKAVNSRGKVATSYKPMNAVYLRTLVGGASMPESVKPAEFSDGTAIVTLTPTSETNLKIKADDGTISGESGIMKVAELGDVTESAKYYDAVTFLKKNGVVNGYPDGTFKPENVVSRVEALKFILEGANSRLISVSTLPFTDASANEWYSEYIATGFSKNIVRGYEDSTFRPTNTVNRAEFIKMLVLALELKMDTFVTRAPYKDVPMDAWYAIYARYAQEKNLVDAGEYFRPEEGMTRAEVAETLYRAILLKVSGADKYSDGMSVADAGIQLHFS